jgi:hypothetical protein
MKEKQPKVDFGLGDNVIQPLGVLHDKPIVKPRVSKGKENRRIDTVDLTSDLDRLGTANAKNLHRTSHRLSSEKCHENGPLRKKHSIDVTNSPTLNNAGCLASEVNTCVSARKLSCGKSRYYSCSQNFPKSTVLTSESGCISVDEVCSTSKDKNATVNSSVIIVSDSSSTSSAITNSHSEEQIEHSLSSRTGKHRNDVRRGKCTIIIDSSDSENDVLDASCEAPFKFTPSIRTPLHSDIKPQTHSNTRLEKVGGSVANLEYVLPSTPLQPNNAKYKDIEDWLFKVKSLNGSDHNDPDKMLEANTPQKTEVARNSMNISVGMNLSCEEILDNLYGETWRDRNMHLKRSQTERPKKKCSRNIHNAGQYTERYAIHQACVNSLFIMLAVALQ